MVDDDYLEGDSLALSSIDLPGRDHLWLVRRVTLESGTGRKEIKNWTVVFRATSRRERLELTNSQQSREGSDAGKLHRFFGIGILNPLHGPSEAM